MWRAEGGVALCDLCPVCVCLLMAEGLSSVRWRGYDGIESVQVEEGGGGDRQNRIPLSPHQKTSSGSAGGRFRHLMSVDVSLQTMSSTLNYCRIPRPVQHLESSISSGLVVCDVFKNRQTSRTSRGGVTCHSLTGL